MNKKIISFVTAGVLIVASLNVCAFAADSVDKGSQTSQVTSTANSESTIINLEVFDTTDITQNVGGIAGITWEYSIEDPSIVSFNSEKSSPYPTGVFDAITQHTWTFAAYKPGTTKITFTSRSQTKVYTINVKDTVSKSTIDLSVGQTTDITQNVGGIAGITWKYSIGDSSIVSLKSEKSSPYPVGVADAFTEHTWTFVANKAGTTKITFTSRFETKVYTINVKDSNPQRKIIRLKVGGTTTISKPTGGLYGVRYDINVAQKKIIDITDIKMIPPPEGSYDLPVTKVWTLTAKRLGITKIIVTGSSRISDTAGASIEEYIVIVSNK